MLKDDNGVVDKDIKTVVNDIKDTPPKVATTNRVHFMKMPYIVCLKGLTNDEYKEFIRLFNKITEGKNTNKK